MKHFRFLLLCALLSLTISTHSQTKSWECGYKESLTRPTVPNLRSQQVNLVVVYLDFPDGRIDGVVPTTEEQLSKVPNLDAVVNMGYLSDDGKNFSAKCRKYTYLDCWNRYFSRDIYVGDEAHPDWLSHGRFGLPERSAGGRGDTARAYGSLADYFWETSYGNVDVIPYPTHTTSLGEVYEKGIVNNFIADDNNVYHVVPIMLPSTKTVYFQNGEAEALDAMTSDATARLQYLHQLSPSHPDYIEFSINGYGGKVMYIFAGGTFNYGGVGGGNICIVREKLSKNYTESASRCVINGITVSCHELGHLLGFGHSRVGNYCVMTSGTDNQNCPSHFNIAYKLQAGWIPRERIRFYNTNSEISSLPPSEYFGDCAIVTVYGKAGYAENPVTEGPNLGHSEYVIFENRRMLRDDPNIKFDKKFVWRDERMPDPQKQGFNGGCLVTKYSNYSSFPLSGMSYQVISADMEMEVAPEDEGHSNHFFGVQTLADEVFTFLTDNDNGEDRTKSSFDLKTGIQFTNINSAKDGNIDFTSYYGLGEPPDYEKVLYGQVLPDPFIMNGTYFLHASSESPNGGISGNVEMEPGALIESLNKGLQYVNNGSSNFEAIGTDESPIIFQGAGYSQHRLNFTNFGITNNNNTNTSAVIVKNCNFISNVLDRQFSIGNVNSDKPVIIDNINMSGNGVVGIYINNSESNVNINNLNFSEGTKILRLTSTTNNPNHAVLNSITNSEFDEYHLVGTWRFDFENDFVIADDEKLFIVGATGYKNEIIYTYPFKTIINGKSQVTGDFTTNADFYISQTGTGNFNAWDKNGVPSMDNYIKFPGGKGIFCDGKFNASAIKDSLYFTADGDGNWNGIKCEDNSNFTMKNVKIKNAVTGVDINNPQSFIDIQECRFFSNQNNDILISDVPAKIESDDVLIKNNIFTGNINKISSVACINSPTITVEGNQFDEDYGTGLYLLWVDEPVITQNIFQAAVSGGGNPPLGIYSYSSGGFYSCNDITNYSDGILLDNSSPHILNSNIFNNGVGLYCTNSSNPVLSPAYGNYLSGYNSIFNNLNEEIYCNNNSGSDNLPFLDAGYNSIYDEVYQGCLINLGTVPLPFEYDVSKNYWGGGDPINFLCPQNITFIYEPYSTEPPSYSGCDPATEPAGNKTPVLKNRKIESLSQKTEIEKYYDYIEQMLTIRKMLGGYGNKTYYENISENRFHSLINEFLNFKPFSETIENDKVNIEEGRNSIKESKDKPVNSDNPVNSDKPVNNDKSESIEKQYVDLTQSVDIITLNETERRLEYIKKLYQPDNLNFGSMSANEKISLLDKIVLFKLFELALLNHIPSGRPLSRMDIDKKPLYNVKNEIPKSFKLQQNYPNPFNPTSTIKYEIPKNSFVKIVIYDLLGREVKTLVNEVKEPGYYTVLVDASNFASGVYIYHIEAGDFVQSRKMVLIK